MMDFGEEIKEEKSFETLKLGPWLGAELSQDLHSLSTALNNNYKPHSNSETESLNSELIKNIPTRLYLSQLNA